MPKRITCPHCRSELRLPEELYEGPAQCPCCEGAFTLRWHQRGVRTPETEALLCRFCGKPLAGAESECPACGERPT